MGLLTGTARRLIQNLFWRTRQGVLSSSGRLRKGLAKTQNGVLSSTGTARRLLQNLFSRTRQGVLSFAGAVQRLSQNIFSRTKDGVLSFAGSAQRLLQNLFSRTKNGVLSVTGLITRLFESSKSTSGSIYPSGTYSYITTGIKQYAASYLASISFSGAYSYVRVGSQRLFNSATSGALSFIGNLYKGWLWGTVTRIVDRFKTISSTLSMVGNVISDRGQSYAVTLQGILSSSGTHAYWLIKNSVSTGLLLGGGILTNFKELGRTYTGVLTPTGLVKRSNAILTKLYAGSLAFSGNVFIGIYRTLSGSLSSTGHIILAVISKRSHLSNLLTFSGAFYRNIITRATRSGILILSGMVSGVKSAIGSSYWVGETGILSLTGLLTGLKEKADNVYGGVLGIIGRVTIIDIIMKRITAASITPSGILLRKLVTNRTKITSSLSLTGILTYLKRIPNSFSGAISFVGTVTNDTTGGIWNYTANGVLAIAGAVSRIIGMLRLHTGAISPTGIIKRTLDVFESKTGILSFAGQVLGLATGGNWRLGNLAFAGKVSPYWVTLRPTQRSSLTVSGRLTRILVMARLRTGDITCTGIFSKYKDILYYGPPNP